MKAKQKRNEAPNKRRDLEAAAKELTREAQVDAAAPEKQLTVLEKCDLLAELCESALETPQKAFTSVKLMEKGLAQPIRGVSPMKQLLTMASAQETEDDRHVAQLAILSLMAVFKDLIPNYRIKPPTDKQLAVKVSKDVKELWDYERDLLSCYQQYLKLLESTWNREKGKATTLALTSILTLAQLLQVAYHFNFRSGLLMAVVKAMNYPRVGEACRQAIQHVFANDAQGEVALEAARQVSKLLRDRHFSVSPSVLGTFIALPLRVHTDEAEAAALASQANRKKRKRDKDVAAIESELAEANATVDKIVLARCQSETLQTVMITYFRILKSEGMTSKHSEVLLPTALEGLAKFAHLINFDTVLDLLEVLKSLLLKVDALPLDASLNCILTAFETLQGPGRELKVDVKDYIVPLYSQLPRFISEDHSLKHTESLLKCLNSAFMKHREFSTVRLAAFVKSILTVALHTSPHTSIPLLAFVQQLLHRYSSVHPLLENENDIITEGEYTPDVLDPERANPLATSAWELATLRFHIHPKVAQHAKAVASLQVPNLPTEGYDRLRREIMEDQAELRFSFQRSKKKHPLTPKENNKNRKKDFRFITPHPSFQFLFVEEEQEKTSGMN
jgi:nucleolar complex protein 3